LHPPAAEEAARPERALRQRFALEWPLGEILKREAGAWPERQAQSGPRGESEAEPWFCDDPSPHRRYARISAIAHLPRSRAGAAARRVDPPRRWRCNSRGAITRRSAADGALQGNDMAPAGAHGPGNLRGVRCARTARHDAARRVRRQRHPERIPRHAPRSIPRDGNYSTRGRTTSTRWSSDARRPVCRRSS